MYEQSTAISEVHILITLVIELAINILYSYKNIFKNEKGSQETLD